MHISYNDLIYAFIGLISAYFTFKLNLQTSNQTLLHDDRDYIVEQNKRLNEENEQLRKENARLRRELLKHDN